MRDLRVLQEEARLREACDFLGLGNAIRLERRRFARDSELEYYLYASLDANQDANFLDLWERIREPTLLLGGTLGEIWYPKHIYHRGASFDA